MVSPALREAFDRTEKEVIGLASQSEYQHGEFSVCCRRNRFAFYSSVSPVWLMEHGERAALSMLADLIKPKIVIEIGTRYGGSAFLFAEKAGRVICIDIDEKVRERVAGISNIEVLIGRSVDAIPRVLSDLRQNGSDFDLALIDGDHSTEAVTADIEAFIATRPTRPCWIILHDTFNPWVRAGIRSVDWNKPWVSQVEIDFVPGNIMPEGFVHLQMWGGIGVIELQPHDRTGPLLVNEEGKLLFEAALKVTGHATRPVSPIRRLVRNIRRKMKTSPAH
jgi:hypothetical protein